MRNDLTLLVPVYNEAESLQALLPGWIEYCTTHNYKLIIVNDGSNDNTKEVLKHFETLGNFKVFHHKINRGYGAALKTGIKNADTEFILTMDADGQHPLSNIPGLINVLNKTDGDMVVGSRKHLKMDNAYREIGKWIIRRLAKILFSLSIYDINSGLKVFKTELAQRYIKVCPDTMAFSDIILLVFINQGHLVIEHPINIDRRLRGNSTISTRTAFETVWEIINITMLFRPIKIFLPISVLFIITGIVWELPIIFTGRGLSVGASLLILIGFIFFFLGLIAEQFSVIIKSRIE